MIIAIASAEFRYQFWSLQTLVTFIALFGFTFLLTANGGEFQTFAPGGNVLANAPYVIMDTLIKLSVAAVFAVPPFIAGAVLKDVDYRFDAILFATPIDKRGYLIGRFSGAFAALLVALAGAPLGLLLGTFWPWADTEVLGPTHIDHYLVTYFGILLPSVLAISAMAFAVAVISRSLMHTYVTIMAVLVLYLVAGSSESFPPLLDPFLFEVFDEQTRYWTAAERNTRLMSYQGSVLYSRLLWTAIAGVFFLVAYRLFSFHSQASTRRLPESSAQQVADSVASIEIETRGTPQWGLATLARQFLLRTGFEVKSVLKSVPFLILMALTFFLYASQLMEREVVYGVNAYPVTRLMVSSLFAQALALLVVLAFYSADIIWRERTHGIHEIIDALPAPNGVFVASKLAALAFILISILVIGVTIAISVQILSGYYRFEWGLYLERGLIFPVLPYLCLAVLTCFFQVVAGSRYLGMMLFGLFILAIVVSRDTLGLEHPLISYGFPAIAAPLSDMNGTGRFMALAYWARAYWGSIAGLLLILTYLLWRRGTMQPLRYRLRSLKALRSTGYAIALIALMTSLLGTGGFIYYNTNVVNEYHTESEVRALQVTYEKSYRRFEGLPMPRIVEVRLEVDLYPGEQRLEARATQVLENKTASDLATVHVVFPPNLEVVHVQLEGGTPSQLDNRLVPYYIFDLAKPMPPGERRALDFEVIIQREGFPHRSPDTRLVGNGTFITSGHFTPTIGFEPDYMIDDRHDRRRHDLPPLPRRPRLEDSSQYHNNPTRQDSDFIAFQATISTVADQTAVTLGVLQNEWLVADRRYFSYKMDAPIRNFYSVVSADYTVARDQWHGIDIEVLYHAPHTYNIDRMIESVKDSLSFYSENFSPYPFRQVRIAEIPAFRDFLAQSFPGTIPYSEGGGFIAQVRAADIDMPYYITAHEMAHQWWGHVVTAANTQGDAFIHETLAQYSALRVMERKYGKDKIRQFLKHELDRYLAGRGDDPEGELPLNRVESQKYIHYRKGSLVMYAIRDYLGADVVDRSLRRLVELRAFSSKPYAISTDFLDILKEEAGPDQVGMIEDWFEKITLYDLRLVNSEVEELPDGRYKVQLSVDASKSYADADGIETDARFDLPVEIGLFLNSPAAEDYQAADVILLEKRLLDDGQSTIEIVVDSRPMYAGIDPYHKLIDRDSNDNLRAVR